MRADGAIPTAQLIQIIDGEEDLLASALDHARDEHNWSEEILGNPDAENYWKGLIAKSRADPTVRLSTVSLTLDGGAGFGAAFLAQFSGSASGEGVTVTFSVTDGGFVVHRVGRWIA